VGIKRTLENYSLSIHGMSSRKNRGCSTNRVNKQQVQQSRILNEVCCDGECSYHACKTYQKAPALNWSLRLALRARSLLSKEFLQFLLDNGHACWSLAQIHLYHLLEESVEL